MSHAHHAGLVMRHAPVRRDVVPSHRLPFLVPSTTPLATMPSLVARAPESSASGSTNGEKPTSNMTTTVLPVVLGAGLPILCAIIVLIVLHRRHVKKLLREDANDKHKSLDFGMDTVGPATQRRGPGAMPPRSEPNHTKGLSLDVGPYLIPPGMKSSRDSLHSISRSIDDDKYRPATFLGDNGSVRSFPRGHRDEASSFGGSPTRYGAADEPDSGLLRNAQRMSRSSPPIYSSPTESHRGSPVNQRKDFLGPVPGVTPPAPVAQEHSMAPGSATTDRDFTSPVLPHLDSTPSLHFGFETETNHASAPEERLNFPLPEPSQSPHDSGHGQTASQLPRISLPASDVTSSDYGDDRKSELMIPPVNVHATDGHHDVPSYENKHPELPEEPQNLDKPYDEHRDTRRMTLGLRPLPPEDPADNPEQRANRIRSFYKEYFDESKTGRETTYYEDFGPEFYEDGGFVYDPVTGDYFDAAPAPFAEPVTRRAMTPPPRAPPRFQGAARHQATNSAGFNGFSPGPRSFSSASGPRAFSSASGRMPGPRAPRKPMPPPAPLQVLPTPHMLRDESLMSAVDFAPANGFRDQRAGRPETPTGGMRPYSPAVRAHTPLASAFDELAVMPSPHALRKSGTYTNLDFVPPPRFKNEGAGSDAGSIRSNRTGVSNTHMNNIRMGNYRISRLPADTVGTKDDLMTSLRPHWDLNNNK